MKESWRKQLQARYKRAIGVAIGKALADDSAPPSKDEIQQLENYSKLLELTRPGWTADSGWAFVVAVICISVGAILWSKNVSHTNISLVAETDSLAGGVSEDWDVDRPFLRSKLMHLEGLTKIQSPGLGVNFAQNHGNAWIKLMGGQVSLESLGINKGAKTELAAGEDEISLFVSLKPMRGRVTVLGSCTIIAGEKPGETVLSRHYDLAVPETLEFEVTDPTQVPSRITVHGPEKWNLSRVPLANLSFVREEISGPAKSKFISGARAGSIRFNDTSWPAYEIAESELWSVPQTEHAIVEVRSANPLIHVTLNGTVKNVTVGPEGDRRELVPSYLEYLYNRKSVSLFWGVVVLAWGTLWGIRKTIFR